MSAELLHFSRCSSSLLWTIRRMCCFQPIKSLHFKQWVMALWRQNLLTLDHRGGSGDGSHNNPGSEESDAHQNITFNGQMVLKFLIDSWLLYLKTVATFQQQLEASLWHWTNLVRNQRTESPENKPPEDPKWLMNPWWKSPGLWVSKITLYTDGAERTVCWGMTAVLWLETSLMENTQKRCVSTQSEGMSASAVTE